MVLNRLVESARRIRRQIQQPRARTLLFTVGLIAFLTGVAVSWAHLEIALAATGWGWLVLLVAAGILVIPLNAWEYIISVRYSGIDVDFKQAVVVTTHASALNMLPIPAGAAYRLGHLSRTTTSPSKAFQGLGLTATVWLGLSSLIAGVVLALNQNLLPSLAFGGGTILSMLLGGVLLNQRTGRSRRTVGNAALAGITVGVEGLFLIQAALRLWLAGQLLQSAIPPVDTFLLASAGAFAATIGIIPGALGIWEGVTALTAGLTTVPPSVAFLCAAAVRLTGYVSLAAMLLLLWLRKILSHRTPSAE